MLGRALPMLRVPPTSLISDMFCYRESDTLYGLINREPELLNARDRKGRTWLHMAVDAADLAAVEIFLFVGVDKALQDSSGRNSLEYLDFLVKAMKKWKGGYSAQLNDTFDQIRQHLQR